MWSSSVSPQLHNRILEFGQGVFADLEDYTISPLEVRYWNARLMEWAMKHPEFKVNLFRLVDVLPTLTSDDAIADHVRQYLTEPANKIHPSLGWLIGFSNSCIGSAVTARAVKLGVQQMAGLFIAGNTPQASLPILRKLRQDGFAFTVDLLGEFCVCEREAFEYQARYIDALDTFGPTIATWSEGRPIIADHPGESSPVCISVKLSALYSQTGVLNFARSVDILSERLAEIVRRAKRFGALVYVDAEDSGNNSIIYETFKRVFGSAEFSDVPYPGIVIQAYAKNAADRVHEMLTFARMRAAPIAIRLVKGAYWDFERVVSAQNHWEFPLWERKHESDAWYEHLSRVLLDNRHLCLPAFGSHNIRSLAHACCYAESKGLSPKDFEIQVLYGMAEPIAHAFAKRGYLTRMYVPLGELLPGMGYLVRRLLENTSNESFLRHTFFDRDETAKLLADPAALTTPSAEHDSDIEDRIVESTDTTITVNLEY
jgi:RHH-type proline utilization regulon transcriptional repressor/proline dehydrogenase/delta 1-pyrroline-5-carboxylate dehydrogenase